MSDVKPATDAFVDMMRDAHAGDAIVSPLIARIDAEKARADRLAETINEAAFERAEAITCDEILLHLRERIAVLEARDTEVMEALKVAGFAHPGVSPAENIAAMSHAHEAEKKYAQSLRKELEGR